LKDKTHYLTSKYSRPQFCQFYEDRFSIMDENLKPQTGTPSEKDLNKIHVFWNSAMGVFGKSSRINKLILLTFPVSSAFLVGLKSSSGSRENNISCRIRTEYQKKTVGFQRKEAVERLKKRFELKTGHLNYKQYIREMLDSKIAVSPFGSGEIAYRDFEIFTCGTALLKPDMSFVDTWPNLYKDQETYSAYQWDFSNLEEKVEYLLSNNNWKEIAEKGQERYRYYLSNKKGREEFCRRVVDIANRDY
jgi:hypothetical protein